MRRSSFCLAFFLSFLFFLLFSSNVSASSSYVLPYPSAMPGSSFYKINKVYEYISKYWYFGDFGGFDYNLKYSDKYLVEAKTLFEYDQYLLAVKALEKSDYYFREIEPKLADASQHHKNISEKIDLLKEASLKHIDVLNEIKKSVPGIFIWRPEKSKPITLFLEKQLDDSIRIREKSI